MGENISHPKNNIWLPLLFALVMMAGMVIGVKLQDSSTIFERMEEDGEDGGSMELPIIQAVRYIESKYVDSINTEELTESAIQNLMQDLDPHSVYLSKSMHEQSDDELHGSFVGIGIDYLMLDDTLTIRNVIESSPADIAGLASGDKILKVEERVIAGVEMTADSIVGILKGKLGESVSITCWSKKKQEEYVTDVIRDHVDLWSIPCAFMLDERTGFIKINSFTATTPREFAQAIQALIKDQGMQDLIIDIRGNSGGYLDNSVIPVLNHIFLDKNKLLVYTSGTNVGKKDYESNGHSRLNIKKIAVLIDEESASASEILAGALQDWDRAVIIGRRSFGKGLVQEELSLVNGGAIRVTIARYYTPSGRCIQKDYSDRDEYQNDLQNRYDEGELFADKETEIKDTTKYFTANGRLVHGGGGISPEIYIPLDTVIYNHDWAMLRRYLDAYVLLKSIPVDMDKKEFVRSFTTSDALVDDFLNYAESKSEIHFSTNKYRPYIKKYLKADLGQSLFGAATYYEVEANEKDPFVTTALKQLKKEDVLSID